MAQDVNVQNFPEMASKEEVAFKLMHLIGKAEAREAYGHGEHPMTRDWVLKTYSQCLSVVRGADAEAIWEEYQPQSFAKPGS